MPTGRIAWLLLAGAGLLLDGCGDSGRPPGTSGTLSTSSIGSGGSATGSGGSTGGTAGSGTGGGAAGGAAGEASGGTQITAGAAGADTHEVACGDGLVEDREDCEPSVFMPPSCEGFGYQTGFVQCNANCRYDFGECVGVEDCFDGEDNDGDEERDCDDADCEAACQSSCAVTGELPDGYVLSAHNRGHAEELSPSCSPQDHGPEVVYAVEALETGVLEAIVAAGDFPRLTVSIRTACDDDGSELSCGENRALAPVTEGDTLFVVVQGISPADEGQFELFARSRPENVCGDGSWDSAEACEDGGQQSGDGCDASCQVEPNELEPNQDRASANSYSKPFFGEISPAGDEDWVKLEIADAPSYIIANVLALGANGCAFGLMDPELELRDADGVALAVNDDFDSTCPRLQVEDLSAGTYYLRVTESLLSMAPRAEFPYELRVTVDHCGNGVRGPLEACDDGNLDALDGCDASCRVE